MTPLFRQAVVDYLVSTYTLSFGLLVSAIGAWSWFLDSKAASEPREAKIYRLLGVSFTVAGLGGAAVLKILM